MQSVAVIDYNMGNIQSVVNAVKALGFDAYTADNPKALSKALRIILPGVGAFEEGINNLKKLGLADILNKQVLKNGVPFLGICLGMQLICRESHENGIHNGLGWINATVKKLGENVADLRIPHIGWNVVTPKKPQPLFRNMPDKPTFYFVHSYCCVCEPDDVVSSECFYGVKFVSSVQKGNIFATQFHPEKSQQAGLRLIKNFIECEQN
ncbi:MAG: imidazole glycerol phosphate synthase subunit HisH [Candidatus Omnitrophota bacterium]